MRRLNLHLVGIMVERGGALLVDATRRGRALPDSFAKTVPIWCACVNRALAAERRASQGLGAERPLDASCTELHTSPSVDPVEKEQIEKRLDGFVDKLRGCAGVGKMLSALHKPLRPLWLTAASPDGSLTGADLEVLTALARDPLELPFLPLVCVSASEPVDRQLRPEYTCKHFGPWCVRFRVGRRQ
jgi:tRNA A64-2'-O-ribosylphosphate transferase